MEKRLVLIIFVLAVVLRFVGISQTPALNADEAAIGYNAYSLLETGKDEHGHPWPIHFESFGDYKPGLIFYLVMPFIKLFGLNVVSVRFLPTLLGSLTIILIYYLSKEIYELRLNKYLSTSVLATFLLAVSPWHIQFSRGAWEVNVATFFIMLGTLLFLKAKENKRYYVFSFIFFTLSLYTYHSARLITPLIILGLIFFNFHRSIKQRKYIVIAFIVATILSAPLLKDFLGEAGLSRASGVGLFADIGPFSRINEQRGEHQNYASFFAKVLHNKATNYGLAFLENWGEHYSGEYLFLSGDDIERNKVPETGQMYLFDILLVPLGLVVAIRNSRKTKIVLWWLLIAPVAAALTFQSPHALRSQNMIIPLMILSAYGLFILLKWANNQKLQFRNIIYAFIALFVTWNITRYLHMYWVHMSKEYKYSSQYGVEELVEYIKSRNYQDKDVVVTNRYDQPYILFLFYLKYPPEKFQNSHLLTTRDEFGFSTVNDFANYHFKSIDFDSDKPRWVNSIIVGTEKDIPDEANIVKNIYGSNGLLYFQVVEN